MLTTMYLNMELTVINMRNYNLLLLVSSTRVTLVNTKPKQKEK